MFKQAFSIAAQVFGIVALVIAAIEAGPTQDGATKKAQATTQIQAQINKILPQWAIPVVDPMIGFLIDQGVAYANTNGNFTKSAAA